MSSSAAHNPHRCDCEIVKHSRQVTYWIAQPEAHTTISSWHLCRTITARPLTSEPPSPHSPRLLPKDPIVARRRLRLTCLWAMTIALAPRAQACGRVPLLWCCSTEQKMRTRPASLMLSVIHLLDHLRQDSQPQATQLPATPSTSSSTQTIATVGSRCYVLLLPMGRLATRKVVALYSTVVAHCRTSETIDNLNRDISTSRWYRR